MSTDFHIGTLAYDLGINHILVNPFDLLKLNTLLESLQSKKNH